MQIIAVTILSAPGFFMSKEVCENIVGRTTAVGGWPICMSSCFGCDTFVSAFLNFVCIYVFSTFNHQPFSDVLFSS